MLVPVGSPWREIFRGAVYVPRGFFKILSSPRLWAVSAIPLLLNIIVFALVTYAGFKLVDLYAVQYSKADALSDWHGWWGFVAAFLKAVAYLAYYLKFLMMPVLTAWLLSAPPFTFIMRAIFMPFSTMIGERTEQIVLALPQAKQPFHFGELQASITLTIVNTILLALVQILLYVVLCPLAFIPPLWLVLPPAIMSGMDHTDPSFCRKSYYMRERIALWKARKWRFLGFGVTFFFLLGIPFLNAFVFPTVAAGAAILYLELDRK